jgi:Zn-dependent peptidase ImmA (M78 family)
MYREEPMRPDQSGYFQNRGSFYVIGINSNESQQRKRFTAAHELGHYVLHRDLLREGQHFDRLFTKRTGVNTHGPISPYHEVQANKFAADILMPADLVKMVYRRNQDLRETASEFSVSESAMRIRLENLGVHIPASAW